MQTAALAEGTVIDQVPAPGSLALEGSVVTPTVSTRRGLVTVPDVAGATEADAIVALTGAGLRVGPTTRIRDDAAGRHGHRHRARGRSRGGRRHGDPDDGLERAGRSDRPSDERADGDAGPERVERAAIHASSDEQSRAVAIRGAPTDAPGHGDPAAHGDAESHAMTARRRPSGPGDATDACWAHHAAMQPPRDPA